MTKVTRVRRLNIQRRRKVKKTLVYLGICIVILGLLNACAISSDKKISEETHPNPSPREGSKALYYLFLLAATHTGSSFITGLLTAITPDRL